MHGRDGRAEFMVNAECLSQEGLGVGDIRIDSQHISAAQRHKSSAKKIQNTKHHAWVSLVSHSLSHHPC